MNNAQPASDNGFEAVLAGARTFEANFDRFLADAGRGRVDAKLQASLCSQILLVTNEATRALERGCEGKPNASQALTISIVRGIPHQFNAALESALFRARCKMLSDEQARTTKDLYLVSARVILAARA